MRIPLDIYKLYNKPPERRKIMQEDVFDDDELQTVEDNLKFDFQGVNN